MNPSDEAIGAALRGFQPFWFWNGWIDEAGISEQVRLMAEQGILGFFIHPRQGMDVPYLSPRFFALVDHARCEAAGRGMQVHLYDEYPYPSGVAGGRVTLGNPHFHATRLVQRIYPVEPQTEPQTLVLAAGHVLNATVVPLRDGDPDWSAERSVVGHLGVHLTRETHNEGMGLIRYSRKRFFGAEPHPCLEVAAAGRSERGERSQRLALEGPSRVYVTAQRVVDDHKYWGNYVDVLNPEAVKAFLSETHDRYQRTFGERLRTDFFSIFTDETFPGWSAIIPREAGPGTMQAGGPSLQRRETRARALSATLHGHPGLRSGSHQGRRDPRCARRRHPQERASRLFGEAALRPLFHTLRVLPQYRLERDSSGREADRRVAPGHGHEHARAPRILLLHGVASKA